MTKIGAQEAAVNERASAAQPSVTAVVTQFPAPSQTFIRRKLEGLRGAGIDVTVAAARFSEPSASTGFPYLCLMPWASTGAIVAAESRSAWRAALQSLPSARHGNGRVRDSIATAPVLAIDTDVVHFEFSGIAVSYLDRIGAITDRSHMAVSCRGAAEQIEPIGNPVRQRQLAEVFDAASLIHCVSDDMRRTVEGYGAAPERILVNRPAVPVADFSSLRRPAREGDGPLRVLSIGRLHWKKGLDDGLRAMAALRDRGVDAVYRVAGEGTERAKLEFMIDSLDLGGSVDLLGTCTQDEVRASLAWSDVLLLPSLSEGISNAVLEAMAAGLPVVTTNCGGMTEVVQHGVNGLVVDMCDAEAMADNLAVLAADPSLRDRLGTAAAAHADTHLDLSHQVQRFVDAYGRLRS